MPGSVAERFHQLFEGAARSHGTYDHHDTNNRSDGKVEIRKSARTLREPVTVELWERHLTGERPLGIVAIREDECCLWGAIDVDEYSTDIAALAALVDKEGLNALVCRTKSGGAHVYVFFSEPIPAKRVVPRLRDMAAFIGHGNAEIFPKQEKVLADKGDLGSWINMPYFGGDETNRYAVQPDARGMTAEAFLTVAEQMRMTADEFYALDLVRRVEGFGSGPPCLETMAANRVPRGSQNNALLNYGILAKKMHPDDWPEVLARWNATVLDPPGSEDGLKSVIRSLRRKEYNYQCRKEPMCSHCNVAVCKTRPHGVGDGAAEKTILDSVSILETDPPIFFVVLKTGETIEVTSRHLLSMHDFKRAVLDQVGQGMPTYSHAVWDRSVTEIMANATRIEAPDDSGPRGRFLEILSQFVTDRHRGEDRGSLLRGMPWRDLEDGKVYFRMGDLEAALERVRFKPPEGDGMLRSWVTSRLRDMGSESLQMDVRGRNVRVRSLSDKLFEWDVVRHDLPEHEEAPL